MATLALILTTLIWGSTFITVKDALVHVAPLRFVALRFSIAAIALFAAALLTRARFDRATWRAGLIAAVPFFGSFLTQTLGLVWASPAISAFLTGISVVLVPAFASLFLRRRVGLWTWAGVAAALAGLAGLTLRSDGTLGVGELWTLGTAASVAVHVLVLERVARGKSPLALTAVQVLGCAALAFAVLPFESALIGRPGAGPGLFAPLPPTVWLSVLYMALAATGLAFFLQTWAQGRMSAIQVGVLFTLEPVFALLFSIGLGRESFGLRAAVSMGLILIAMVVVETLGHRDPGGAPAH